MPDASPDTVQPPASARGRRRLGIWFAVGFLAAFVTIAIACPMSFYDGRAVYQTVVWRYYVLETQQQIHNTGIFKPTMLGPTSNGLTNMYRFLAVHLFLSIVVGALAALVGLLWRRPRTG